MVPSRNGPRGRRRVVVAGVVAGVLAGIAAGAALLGGATSPASGGPRPEVLHAAPAIVTVNSPVSLGAATVCTKPEAASCAVSTAVAYVRPAGTNGWSRVDGEPSSGGYRFTRTSSWPITSRMAITPRIPPTMITHVLFDIATATRIESMANTMSVSSTLTTVAQNAGRPSHGCACFGVRRSSAV